MIVKMKKILTKIIDYDNELDDWLEICTEL